MSIAFPANKRVAVIRFGVFHDCISFGIEDKISVESKDEAVLIKFGYDQFQVNFVGARVDVSKVHFVLVDPSLNLGKQIIGIAETHWFDESRPGEVYLLE